MSVDYETRVFKNKPIDKIVFRERGYAYGAIRLADFANLPEYRHVAKLFEDDRERPTRSCCATRR